MLMKRSGCWADRRVDRRIHLAVVVVHHVRDHADDRAPALVLLEVEADARADRRRIRPHFFRHRFVDDRDLQAARSSSSSGWNRSTSTPGGTTVIGNERPAARSASLAAYSPADDDVAGPAEHCGERLFRARQPARHGDLGPVQHDVVRQLNDGPTSPSGTAGSSTTRSAPKSAAIGRSATPSMDAGAARAHGRAPSGTAGRRRTRRHRAYGLVSTAKRVRRQPPPPLPQQRLDAADLRREVVRDEEVLHDPGLWCRRPRRRKARRRAETEPVARPAGVLGEHLVVASRGSGQREHRPRASSRAVAGVAEHDERVAPQPPRVTTGDVPPPVAVEQRPRRSLEQVEHVDPRAGPRRRASGGADGRDAPSAGRRPGSRRSRRCGPRPPVASATGIGPGVAAPRRGSGWRR